MFILSAGHGQSREVLPPNKINKLVPGKIKGYSLNVSKSDLLKFGNITYSLCERIFIRKEKAVKILLFDYAEAPVMYTQAMQRWGQMPAISSDSLVFQKTASSHFEGWESYSAKNNHSQLILSIHKRFFMTLTGDHTELHELKSILVNFDFEKFPE